MKIILTYLTSILLTGLIILFLFKIKRRNRKANYLNILSDYICLNIEKFKKISPILILLIFYNFSILFINLILISNIKTNAIVIDTSGILKNSLDILKNEDKIHCFIEGNLD